MNGDKWRELKIWVAKNIDPSTKTAEEAFKAVWYKMDAMEREENRSHG